MAKKRTNRLIVVLLSDKHTGHKLGLLNPETPLVDEHGEPYLPALNKTQQYLWDLYKQHIESVADLADKCPVVVIDNGDPTHGTRYVDHLCLSLISDQIHAAVWTLKPWCDHPRIKLTHIREIVGTGVHGWEGGAEATIARQLGTMYPKIDISARYHACITLTSQQGQKIDCAHHGPHPGSRIHLTGNIARIYLRDAMQADANDGEMPSRVYARAHYHQWVHETLEMRLLGKDVVSDIVLTPSYTGCDDYVRKVVRSPRKLDHGLVALEFEDGLKKIHPLYQELEIRTIEEI